MSSGNGKPLPTIDMVELGTGWVYFEPGQIAPTAEELPHALNQTLIGWLKEHPSFAVRTVLPIVAAGSTVGIHVWFETVK